MNAVLNAKTNYNLFIYVNIVIHIAAGNAVTPTFKTNCHVGEAEKNASAVKSFSLKDRQMIPIQKVKCSQETSEEFCKWI